MIVDAPLMQPVSAGVAVWITYSYALITGPMHSSSTTSKINKISLTSSVVPSNSSDPHLLAPAL